MFLMKGPNKSSTFQTFECALVKICKIPQVILKVQVSFPLNLVSILSTIKHNSSALSMLKHYLPGSKAAH